MSRILFVETDIRLEKLGIMYVSAALKQNGHDTLLCRYECDDIHDCITSFCPDFLAFSVTTGKNVFLFELAANLKKQYGLKTIFGGPHATFFSDSIPEDVADFVVVGQGEKAVVEIVENRAAGRIVKCDFMDLDLIPFPDRELFYRFDEFRDNPIKNIITCRDCPYSCAYCYNHSWKQMFKTETNFMQKRSVGSVISEIRSLKDRYLLRKIMFVDDNFLFHKDWVFEFCEQYRKEIGLPFLCCFSLNLLDECLLERLKAAGLWMVTFAIESADPTVQKTVLNRGHVSNNQIIKALSLLKKYGIKCRMQNMIGLPLQDSIGDALNTLAFNKRHKVADSWVSIFQPYPNTALAEYTLRNGFCDSIENSYADSFFDRTHLNIENAEKINRLQKWWYFIVRYGISKANVRILLEIPIDELALRSLQDLRFEYSRKYLYDIAESIVSLKHNWQRIEMELLERKNFPIVAPLIKKYRFSLALSKILMELQLPSSFTTTIFR